MSVIEAEGYEKISHEKGGERKKERCMSMHFSRHLRASTAQFHNQRMTHALNFTDETLCSLFGDVLSAILIEKLLSPFAFKTVGMYSVDASHVGEVQNFEPS